MRTRSLGEESLLPGDYSVFYPSVRSANKMVFLFCNASACLKCNEPRPPCFISQAVTNSSEVLWLGLNMENDWYSYTDTAFTYTQTHQEYIFYFQKAVPCWLPANFVYSQGLYHIALVLFMSKCIRHDIWDLLECRILALLWQNLAAAQNNFVSQQEAKWARTPCLAGTEGKRGGESLWKQEVIAHTRTGSGC